MKHVSCIIPAHNENGRIAGVLRALHGHPLVSEIIVVDDGSSDDTAAVVKTFSRVRLIRHEQNRGKSAAIYSGLRAVTGPLVMMLDADLLHLSSDDITALIEPVAAGIADVSISLRGNTPLPWRLIGLDYISGERVFAKELLASHLAAIQSLPGYGVEVFFNSILIKQCVRIASVSWRDVAGPYKYSKHGWRGVCADIRMMRNIFHMIGVAGAVAQIIRMRRQLVALRPRSKPLSCSFVIPAYNEEALIGKCLDSIKAQRGDRSVEVIVVDNASTDRTAEIARGRGAKVIGESRKGITFARQAGFEASSGDLIACVDADTILSPGWLDTVFASFERNPKLVALSGPYIYYDLTAFDRALVKVFYVAGWIAHLFNQYVLHTGAMLQGGNYVVRRTALEAIGGFDTSIPFWGEDTDIARRISKIGHVRWTFSLPMLTTGRRLAEEGIFRAGWRYAANFFWTTYAGTPRDSAYTDIRAQ